MHILPAFELENVSKIYGAGEAEVHALRGVDLAIGEGDMLAVTGASGSGKSTAMNILGCLDAPTHGAYRFFGVDVGTLQLDERARLRRQFLGFVFQGFCLLARTSAVENVELPLVYRGVAKGERRARAMQALADVGLDGRERHTPAELSGGQQQRVAIARALVTEPRLLIADEPTGNLDSKRSAEIMALFQRVNAERGITLVLVSHDPDVARFVKRVVTFRDGAVVDDHAGGAA
jgi:putative ABC transport system ATP-binding protein